MESIFIIQRDKSHFALYDSQHEVGEHSWQFTYTFPHVLLYMTVLYI